MEERYRRFVEAALRGDYVTVTNMALDEFKVTLTDTEVELTLVEYLLEIKRLNNAFPGPGGAIDYIQATANEDCLTIKYRVTARFTGTLVNRLGSHQIQGKGRYVVFTSTDVVTFGRYGKIQSIQIDSDTRDIMDQLFD